MCESLGNGGVSKGVLEVFGMRHRGLGQSDAPSGAKCPRQACAPTKDKVGQNRSWQQVMRGNYHCF